MKRVYGVLGLTEEEVNLTEQRIKNPIKTFAIFRFQHITLKEAIEMTKPKEFKKENIGKLNEYLRSEMERGFIENSIPFSVLNEDSYGANYILFNVHHLDGFGQAQGCDCKNFIFGRVNKSTIEFESYKLYGYDLGNYKLVRKEIRDRDDETNFYNVFGKKMGINFSGYEKHIVFKGQSMSFDILKEPTKERKANVIKTDFSERDLMRILNYSVMEHAYGFKGRRDYRYELYFPEHLRII